MSQNENKLQNVPYIIHISHLLVRTKKLKNTGSNVFLVISIT